MTVEMTESERDGYFKSLRIVALEKEMAPLRERIRDLERRNAELLAQMERAQAESVKKIYHPNYTSSEVVKERDELRERNAELTAKLRQCEASNTKLCEAQIDTERRNAELEKENGRLREDVHRLEKWRDERNAKLVELLKNCQNYILNFSRPLYVDGRSCEVDLCAEIAKAVEGHGK